MISDSLHILAGTEKGVYVSPDNGTTWEIANEGLIDSNVVALAKMGTKIFASTYAGVFQSNIDSLKWNDIGLNFTKVNSFFTMDTILFAGTSIGFYMLNNQDTSWSSRNNGLDNDNINSLAVLDTQIIAGTNGSGLFFSTDSGKNWSPIVNNLSNTVVNSIAVTNKFLLVGADLGVYLSIDMGLNWTEGHTNVANKLIRDIATADNYIFVTTDYAVFRSRNNGESWTSILQGELTGRFNSIIIQDTNIYAVNSKEGLFLSKDEGNTWNRISPTSHLYQFFIHNNVFFAGTPMGVLRSTNYGKDWIAANSGLSNKTINGFTSRDSLLFVATPGGIFKSSDEGLNWSASSNGLRDTCVLTLATNGMKIFAGTWSGGVFVSTDNGENWIEYNNGLSILRINCFCCIDTNVFVAPYYGGVSFTSEKCNNWKCFNEGLNNINLVSFAKKDNYIFSGAMSGIWQRPLSDILNSIDNNYQYSTPDRFSLKQNYPNPFNPTTTIPFTISSRSFVSLVVFDLLGKKVDVLINGVLPAGSFSCKWDATEKTSGIYFCRLQTGSYVETKKLIVLR